MERLKRAVMDGAIVIIICGNFFPELNTIPSGPIALAVSSAKQMPGGKDHFHS